MAPHTVNLEFKVLLYQPIAGEHKQYKNKLNIHPKEIMDKMLTHIAKKTKHRYELYCIPTHAISDVDCRCNKQL